MKIKLFMCGGESYSLKQQHPLGLGYLKSNCKGADIEIVPGRDYLGDCDMIGLSATAAAAQEVVDIVERSPVPVVIGGQITLWDGLERYPFAHIVIGEGERAFQRILDGKAPRILRDETIEDIDTITFPDRGFVGDITGMFTSRGCPWNCYFCSARAFWGKPRFHSAEYVVAEAEHLATLSARLRFVDFQDDLFIADRARFFAIMDLWRKRGLHKRFMLHCFVRANLFDEEMARVMKANNFFSVRFGAESGSDRLLKAMNKQTRVEDYHRTIDICNRVGLHVGCSMIRDLPGETEDDKIATRKFRESLDHRSRVEGDYVFRAFPGTRYYDGEDITKTSMAVR